MLILGRLHKPRPVGEHPLVFMHAVTNEAVTKRDDLFVDRGIGDDRTVDANRGYQRWTRCSTTSNRACTPAAQSRAFITALPVACFAVLGALTPRMSHRVGPERLLVAALVLSTAGTCCGLRWLGLDIRPD